jgi:hypothetical protein
VAAYDRQSLAQFNRHFQFFPFRILQKCLRCWVPSFPENHLGRLAPPSMENIDFQEPIEDEDVRRRDKAILSRMPAAKNIERLADGTIDPRSLTIEQGAPSTVKAKGGKMRPRMRSRRPSVAVSSSRSAPHRQELRQRKKNPLSALPIAFRHAARR